MSLLIMTAGASPDLSPLKNDRSHTIAGSSESWNVKELNVNSCK